MIRLAIIGVLAAAAMLTATLDWELGAFSAAEPADAPPPRVAVAPPPATVPDHVAEWTATILARPLFSPDRRPSTTTSVSADNQTPDGLPRLAGVLVGPFGRSAIFAVEGHKPVVVTEGGRINAWTIRSIEVGTVEVSGPGGARTLHPSFQSSSAAAGQAPAGQSNGYPRTQ